jgi:hypothetical protein
MSESDTHGGSSLTFDGVLLDASSWVAAAVLDSLDRPQAVWIRPEGIKHGYRTGYWHIGVLPGTSGAQWCDMVLDSVGQPIVAFVAQDNSIWLAHGVDVVGAEEEQKVTGDARRAATLVRGELRLHGAEPAELLDLSGRRVRHLEPGANDVRGLRAGVYFLRERTGPAVRVIVTQ